MYKFNSANQYLVFSRKKAEINLVYSLTVMGDPVQKSSIKCRLM